MCDEKMCDDEICENVRRRWVNFFVCEVRLLISIGTSERISENFYLIRLANVNLIEEWCQGIREVMSRYSWMMSKYNYSKTRYVLFYSFFERVIFKNNWNYSHYFTTVFFCLFSKSTKEYHDERTMRISIQIYLK
jgi:outer membrane usher protein FimD/PapC